MSLNAKFGASQGRVVHSESGGLQCFPQNSWQKEFQAASRIGLSFIELLVERKPNKSNPFWSSTGRDEIREVVSKSNMEIYSCCFDYVIDHSIADQDNNFISEMVEFFKGCADLSIPVIVLPLLEKSDLNSQTYKDYVPLVQDIADNFLSKSAELCIESLLPASELLEFLALVDRKNVSCVYDSGNRIVDGADLASEIMLLKDWIKHFHLKDKNADGANVILGTGLVNFDEVFGALKKINYQGHFNFETTRGVSPEKTMAYHYYFSNFFLNESYREVI